MTVLANTYLRGIRFSSHLEEGYYNQYLILIDQPKDTYIDITKFTFVEPTGDGTTSFSYTYVGTVVNPVPGQPVTTYMLPVCWSEKNAASNEAGDNLTVTVTDNSSNSASDDPNAGKPPKLKYMTCDSDFTGATAVVMSASDDALSNPMGGQFFLVGMVHTLPNGGFGKLFQSIAQSPDHNNPVATRYSDPTNLSLLSVDVFLSNCDEFGYLYVPNPDEGSVHRPFLFNFLDYTPV